jgi:hypothetical protein
MQDPALAPAKPALQPQPPMEMGMVLRKTAGGRGGNKRAPPRIGSPPPVAKRSAAAGGGPPMLHARGLSLRIAPELLQAAHVGAGEDAGRMTLASPMSPCACGLLAICPALKERL